MESDDLTIRVLIEIRDEIRSTNQRVDRTNDRVDHLSGGLEDLGRQLSGRIDNLGSRMVEAELRTSTAITELHGTIHDVHSLLVDRLDLRHRVERCERDIDDLKRRVS